MRAHLSMGQFTVLVNFELPLPCNFLFLRTIVSVYLPHLKRQAASHVYEKSRRCCTPVQFLRFREGVRSTPTLRKRRKYLVDDFLKSYIYKLRTCDQQPTSRVVSLICKNTRCTRHVKCTQHIGEDSAVVVTLACAETFSSSSRPCKT